MTELTPHQKVLERIDGEIAFQNQKSNSDTPIQEFISYMLDNLFEAEDALQDGDSPEALSYVTAAVASGMRCLEDYQVRLNPTESK